MNFSFVSAFAETKFISPEEESCVLNNNLKPYRSSFLFRRQGLIKDYELITNKNRRLIASVSSSIVPGLMTLWINKFRPSLEEAS